MYEPYPSAERNGQAVEQGQRPPAPPPVRTAVRLMYAGAAIGAIALVLNIVASGNTRHLIRTRFPHYTTAQVNSATDSVIAASVIYLVIVIGLWLLVAWAAGRGKNWARITGTILFGLNTLLTLGQLAAGGAAFAIAIVTWLIGLGTVIMLWRRESSEFFRRPLY